MPRTTPERPRMPARSRAGNKLLAAVLLAGLVYFGVQWWQGRQPSAPARPAMAPATVVRTAPAGNGALDVTIRYSADGRTHEITKPVDAAAFRAQGRVAWVCYAPGDATDASIRLPQDRLCDQKGAR